MTATFGDHTILGLEPIELPALGDAPLVSILLTNHNYGRFVEEAVQSALDQTYVPVELIVVDDASTDDSVERLLPYQDQGVKLILRTADSGAGHAHALNLAFDACQGEIVCFLDADDVFAPGKVEAVVRGLQVSERGGLCVHPLQYIDGDCRPLDRPARQIEGGWLAPKLFRYAAVDLPGTTALALRRPIAARIFPLPSSLHRLADAYIILVSVCLTHVTVIDTSLAKYRIHGRNLSNWVYPTLDRLLDLIDDIERVTTEFNRYAAELWGPSLQLNCARNAYYCEIRLAAGRLQGRRLSELRPLLDGLASPGRRRLWELLLRLPPITTWAWLVLSWGAGPKYFLQRLGGHLTRVLGRRSAATGVHS